MPKADALQLVDAYQGKRSDRDSDPNKRIETYYTHRIEVENWLRGEAERQGVTIMQRHALYFCLVKSAREEKRPDVEPHHTSIALAAVDRATCTFTIGDSFCNYRFVETGGWESYGMGAHAHSGKVLTMNDVAIIEGALASGRWDDNPYIEVQMWDRPKI